MHSPKHPQTMPKHELEKHYNNLENKTSTFAITLASFSISRNMIFIMEYVHGVG
jgi:hypothetical protein